MADESQEPDNVYMHPHVVLQVLDDLLEITRQRRRQNKGETDNSNSLYRGNDDKSGGTR